MSLNVFFESWARQNIFVANNKLSEVTIKFRPSCLLSKVRSIRHGSICFSEGQVSILLWTVMTIRSVSHIREI